MIAHAADLIATGMPIIIDGDFNVMPTERDVYKPERWLDDALFAPEIREAYARILAQGWTDALRTLHPDETIYTFWDYFRNAFACNAELRIDHLLLSPDLAPRLAAAGVDREVRGWEKTSDHCASLDRTGRDARSSTSAPATGDPSEQDIKCVDLAMVDQWQDIPRGRGRGFALPGADDTGDAVRPTLAPTGDGRTQ